MTFSTVSTSEDGCVVGVVGDPRDRRRLRCGHGPLVLDRDLRGEDRSVRSSVGPVGHVRFEFFCIFITLVKSQSQNWASLWRATSANEVKETV